MVCDRDELRGVERSKLVGHTSRPSKGVINQTVIKQECMQPKSEQITIKSCVHDLKDTQGQCVRTRTVQAE